jgi:hypothetical protein
MTRFFSRKKAIAVAAVCSLIAGVGAYAYWTQAGSGSGTAATGTTAAGSITVNQTSTPTGLYPGGPAGALSGDFTNTNAGNVKIHQVSATVTSVTLAGGADGGTACTPSDYLLSNFPYTVDAEVPGTAGTGGGVHQGSWGTGAAGVATTIQLRDTAVNQDACKGAIAHVTYTSDGV